MSPPHIEVRLAVCVCNVAAIISGFGICTPVRSVREKWKVLEKKNSGRDEKALNLFILRRERQSPEGLPRSFESFSLTSRREQDFAFFLLLLV